MSTDRVALRKAVPTDLGAIAHVMYDDPEPPLVRFFGGIERASAVGRVLVMSELEITVSHATVAVLNGVAVGVLECGVVANRLEPRRVLRALPRAIGAVGAGQLLPVLYRLRYRQRVQFAPVAGAFPVGALYVSPDLRGQGIGGVMLSHADQLALDAGVGLMSIETGVTNPARRLYERHGFRLEAVKTDAAYERMTGSAGRVLLLKNV